jgi:5-oxoprolinase (ATP-hydrolysing)
MKHISTLLLEPDCFAYANQKGDVIIEIEARKSTAHKATSELDTTQLSIFSHRFMSIAEQMGRYLDNFTKL